MIKRIPHPQIRIAFAKASIQGGREISEAEIDNTLADSFPASDPPSWTRGTDRHAATIVAARQPSPKECAQARFQGKHVASIASKLNQ
jgi:hypothetical protein